MTIVLQEQIVCFSLENRKQKRSNVESQRMVSTGIIKYDFSANLKVYDIDGAYCNVLVYRKFQQCPTVSRYFIYIYRAKQM